jgi:hypothetical protein
MILFVSSYINNAHFIGMTIKSLRKNLQNPFDFIVLNDAPKYNDNYLNLTSILTNSDNIYSEIKEEAIKYDCFHIDVNQDIHTKDRPNHSSHRHSEIFKWFFENFDTLYPKYLNYNYICIIDSDVYLKEPLDILHELDNTDLAAPLIYINQRDFYPHIGLFFINLHTVKNIKDMNFLITRVDTGSGLLDFLKNNKHYKIKQLGYFNGYIGNEGLYNDHRNSLPCDIWFDNKFIHLRAGSNFGVSMKTHKTSDNVEGYINKLKLFDIDIDYEYWINKINK